MLHPVGDLPAGVYWRRRALMAGVVLSLVGGGGWLVASAGAGNEPRTQVAASTGSATPSLDTPALEQVVPSLAAAGTPSGTAPTSGAATTESPGTGTPPVQTVPVQTAPAGPVYTEGQSCSDDMIAVDVRPEPAQAAVGSKPTFTLVVTNTSPVACTRSLDAGLREVVLLDAAGTRVWGSNDCFPEVSVEPRTLGAGEVVSYPVLWSGRSSEPSCTATRVNPPAGAYTVQGRLDTDTGTPTAFTLVA